MGDEQNNEVMDRGEYIAERDSYLVRSYRLTDMMDAAILLFSLGVLFMDRSSSLLFVLAAVSSLVNLHCGALAYRKGVDNLDVYYLGKEVPRNWWNYPTWATHYMALGFFIAALVAGISAR